VRGRNAISTNKVLIGAAAVAPLPLSYPLAQWLPNFYVCDPKVTMVRDPRHYHVNGNSQ
jgi:hypothetical protein